MNVNYTNPNVIVGKGMYYLFLAQVFSLLSSLQGIGSIFALLSALVSIYALRVMSGANADYKPAFYMTILNVVLALIQSYTYFSGYTGTPLVLLAVAMYLFDAVLVYLICRTTGNLIGRRDPQLTEQSALLWKVYGICYLVAMARELLVNAPENMFNSDWMNVVAGMFTVLCCFWYLYFLWKCQTLLQKGR